MREISAECAAIANLRVRHEPNGLMHKRVILGNRFTGFDIRMSDQRPNTHVAGAGLHDIILVRQGVQVE